MPVFVWEIAEGPAPSPTADLDSVTATTGGAIDHAQAAVDRLIQWFKKQPNEALIRAFCKPMAKLEQAFIDIISKRNLDNADGEALNVIGRLVGQAPIDGVDEVTYKSLVRARIPANKSNGVGDEILKITRLVFGDYDALDKDGEQNQMRIEARNRGNAEVAIRIHDIDLPWDLASLFVVQFLRGIVGVGVRAILEFHVFDETDGYADYLNGFQLGDAGGSDVGDGGGLGDSVSGLEGGTLAAALE